MITIHDPQEGLKGFEFMQVVIATGTEVTLTGNYGNVMMIENDQDLPSFSITVGVPEPSTILLCAIAGLCFIGIRRRRNG